ncbi:MAG TPA: hypothetical protein VLX90_09320 [Steroidobacteraceae bacterium]|nr:hypothetical protein [Steroidobacteraceae bacterium]
MSSNASARKIAFLSDARHYPEAAQSVQVIETHFSWLFLTGNRVYKLKKPRRQIGMDYRTVAGRLRGCREELRLNRRLARPVYLEVVALSLDHKGRLRFGRGRRTADWLVKMVRLPADSMLDQALARRSVTRRQLSAVVSRLVEFYADAAPRPFTAREYLNRQRRQVVRNGHSLEAMCPPVHRGAVDAAVTRQLDFISREHRALGARGMRVVEAHGDLRPEHVCIVEPVCVIDCLEFSRDLRLLDPAEEIAFLALEIERLGHARFAADLLARYRRLSGDPVSESLIHFYMSRRALTRAMLAATHLTDPGVSDRGRWVHRTRDYLSEALRQAELALQPAAQSASVTGQRERSGARGIPARVRRIA